MALGLQHFDDCVESCDGGIANGHPRLDSDAGEELMRVEPGVAIALGPRAIESPGTLYVTTRRVIWLSDTEKGKGYAVDFLSLSLHAVSRDPEAYPLPCIYTQIELEDGDEEDSDGSDSENSGDLELSIVSEMRLVPSDPGQLDTLFDIFCQCAELNPEPHQEGEEENSWFFGDEEMADAGSDFEISSNPIGRANGDLDLTHRVHELQIHSQQFEDADEDEQESHDDHQLTG
ncbi:chloride conductance regulatory protein ICln-like [Canna indica]|uniref:Chloride conductance regulatory protein ICln-like n=1 Tax=Canna indica TaxID=4628 RepID=A0AAQ3QS27_9LILI|nr:chloride conductance regulatory protein ICln-like [Canna indica]